LSRARAQNQNKTTKVKKSTKMTEESVHSEVILSEIKEEVLDDYVIEHTEEDLPRNDPPTQEDLTRNDPLFEDPISAENGSDEQQNNFDNQQFDIKTSSKQWVKT
jgi:hypothetical protein